MARLDRTFRPDQPLHVIQRGDIAARSSARTTTRNTVAGSRRPRMVMAAASMPRSSHRCLHDRSCPSAGHAGARGQPAAHHAIVRARRHVRYLNTAYHRTGTLREGARPGRADRP